MYNDWLMHYGVKGMHWGVRRTPEQLGHIKRPKTAIHKNLKKFGQDADHNVLFVTGISGSGKSTVALNNQNGKRNVIHLDSYFDNPDGPRDKEFNQFLKKNKFNYKNLMNKPKDRAGWQKWGAYADDFDNLLDAFGKEQYKKGKNVICEGVQLLDDTMHPDKSYFKDKSIIVLSTSVKVSQRRAAKRDGIKNKRSDDDRNYITRSNQVSHLVRKLKES